jgi:hypothetical protein
MSEKRVISLKEVVKDIRAGYTSAELMEKYRFSSVALRKAFRKLIDFKVLDNTELSEARNLYQAADASTLRNVPRQRVNVPLNVYENDNPFVPGVIKDLSETGICIEGIQSEIAQEKCFIIRGGFGNTVTVVFTAKCRWVNKTGRKPVAGYEIIDISMPDAKQLQKLMAQI